MLNSVSHFHTRVESWCKQKGGLKLFWGGGPKKFPVGFSFSSAPTLTSVCEWSLTSYGYPLDEEASLLFQLIPQGPPEYCCIKFSLSFHLVFIVSPWGAFMLWGTRTFSPMPPTIPQGKKDWTEIRFTVNIMQQYESGAWGTNCKNRLASSSKGYGCLVWGLKPLPKYKDFSHSKHKTKQETNKQTNKQRPKKWQLWQFFEIFVNRDPCFSFSFFF